MRTKVSATQIAYAADMTKMLSADSYLHARVHPLTRHDPLADPSADVDLAVLIDLIGNDALLHFQPPPSIPDRLGPVYSAWSTIARDSAKHLPAPRGRGGSEPGPSTDARDATTPFADFVSEPHVARSMVQWIRFQVADPVLQRLFWANNTEADLGLALEELRAADVVQSLVPLTRAIARERDDALVGYAREHLSWPVWTPDTFPMAYAYWAFVKGVGYARRLDARHAYAVHWLRERAVTHCDGAVVKSRDRAPVRVPWGTLVLAALNEPRLGIVNADGFADSLVALRTFTVQNLGPADTPRRRRHFLTRGMLQVLGAVANLPRAGLVASIGRTLAMVGEAAPCDQIAGPSSFLVDLARQVPHARRVQQVHLLLNSRGWSVKARAASHRIQRFLQTGDQNGRPAGRNDAADIGRNR